MFEHRERYFKGALAVDICLNFPLKISCIGDSITVCVHLDKVKSIAHTDAKGTIDL